MEYTWKDQDIVKTTEDLRHETESGTYIPKDTIVKIIGIEQNSGYRVTTLPHKIEIGGITSNDAFQELTEFEKELILECGVEQANELIINRHMEIKTQGNLSYIEHNDLNVNSHCPRCDSMYKWKSDYFMRNNKKPYKIRDSYGYYLVCECGGRWLPTKPNIYSMVNDTVDASDFIDPSRSIADPLCTEAHWLIHAKKPNKINERRSWWGIHYLKEYLEDNQKLRADNKIEEVYILYNDFIRLRKNSGGIYALRRDKNRSRERWGGDGLGMSTYHIQMNSLPRFWDHYLALLINESVLCITRNGDIWKDILKSNNLLNEKLKGQLELVKAIYRNNILAHSGYRKTKLKNFITGIEDFITTRYNPQTKRGLLDAIIGCSQAYSIVLQEINKQFDLDIGPEVYAKRGHKEESIEPVGDGILVAPSDLLDILRIVEKSIRIRNLKAEDVVEILSPEELRKLKEIL